MDLFHTQGKAMEDFKLGQHDMSPRTKRCLQKTFFLGDQATKDGALGQERARENRRVGRENCQKLLMAWQWEER